MVFFNGVPLDSPGLSIVRSWDTLGTRATQSNDLRIDGVLVPEESLFHAYPVGHLDRGIGLSIMSLNVPSFGVISLGVATAGMELARRAAIDRRRAGNAEVQRTFAELEVLLETARAVLYRHAHEMSAYDRGNLAKYVACQNAIAIMDRVMELSGGVGYHRRFPTSGSTGTSGPAPVNTGAGIARLLAAGAG